MDLLMNGGGGGDGGEGDGLPGEPWPGPEEPPSPDGGPRYTR
ncbi:MULTISPECIES: hypothetical protein [Streptomyces]|uniref:Uncharacterized protein n=2 Tax=Streptomyces TaxID=1883 RepID=A0ABD5EQ44_9ACTN|nr:MULTISPECIES: hypothetical protein [unclassified Streptomyces]MDT0436808.1 hypothetical protein [Streptomyces sp. DSM 41981]SCE26676.1 hypothetical protein GA0115242_127510 [Streptomyces sp. SolWspMP-5a-2]